VRPAWQPARSGDVASHLDERVAGELKAPEAAARQPSDAPLVPGDATTAFSLLARAGIIA
jgi:hypothetical protein